MTQQRFDEIRAIAASCVDHAAREAIEEMLRVSMDYHNAMVAERLERNRAESEVLRHRQILDAINSLAQWTGLKREAAPAYLSFIPCEAGHD